MKAVVLHSGGLDSTTLIEKAIEDGADTILALSVQYGSLHNEAEGRAAEEIIRMYQITGAEVLNDISREVFVLPSGIFKGKESALMGEIDMPNQTYAEIRESEGPSPTVVPFRNANLISIAVAVAAARGFDYVYIGAHGEDAHNWAYPDCTPEFLGAMANAVLVGTYNKVRLVFPFIWMQKSDIVRYAAETGAMIDLSWSCYNPKAMAVDEGPTGGVIEFIHCGKCPTCIERANAFAQAGFVDPTEYAIPLEAILGSDWDLGTLESWPE